MSYYYGDRQKFVIENTEFKLAERMSEDGSTSDIYVDRNDNKVRKVFENPASDLNERTVQIENEIRAYDYGSSTKEIKGFLLNYTVVREEVSITDIVKNQDVSDKYIVTPTLELDLLDVDFKKIHAYRGCENEQKALEVLAIFKKHGYNRLHDIGIHFGMDGTTKCIDISKPNEIKETGL